MPTYTYKCEKCQDTFDIYQTLDEKPLKRCKKCKGKLYKVIGIPIVFMRNRTAGALADNNTDKYSLDKKTSITPKGKPKKVEPWYNNGIDKKTQKKIENLKPSETKKYIEEGKLPI
jgi:putative FmdB family regulatory protein